MRAFPLAAAVFGGVDPENEEAVKEFYEKTLGTFSEAEREDFLGLLLACEPMDEEDDFVAFFNKCPPELPNLRAFSTRAP